LFRLRPDLATDQVEVHARGKINSRDQRPLTNYVHVV
jgi:hypothetical protein